MDCYYWSIHCNHFCLFYIKNRNTYIILFINCFASSIYLGVAVKTFSVWIMNSSKFLFILQKINFRKENRDREFFKIHQFPRADVDPVLGEVRVTDRSRDMKSRGNEQICVKTVPHSLFGDNFWSTRTILMVLGSLERGWSCAHSKKNKYNSFTKIFLKFDEKIGFFRIVFENSLHWENIHG